MRWKPSISYFHAKTSPKILTDKRKIQTDSTELERDETVLLTGSQNRKFRLNIGNVIFRAFDWFRTSSECLPDIGGSQSLETGREITGKSPKTTNISNSDKLSIHVISTAITSVTQLSSQCQEFSDHDNTVPGEIRPRSREIFTKLIESNLYSIFFSSNHKFVYQNNTKDLD